MSDLITPIVMPKWGLSMQEGTVGDWRVDVGAQIAVGTPLVEVETDKIANVVEAADPGLLRRIVAEPGQTLPVKALLGVMAAPDVSEREIDDYIASYVVPAAGAADDEAGGADAYVEIDGIRVRHVRRGDFGAGRPPVLFVHGYGGDLDGWLFNLDAAAEHSPVVALDLPGHGRSDAKLPGVTIEALAGFVLRFLDALGIGAVHAVGHSMGGAIVAQMAAAAPQRVASVTLVNPAGLGDEINTGYTEGFVAAQTKRELKPVLEQLFADPGLVSRQMIDDVLKYKRLDGVEPLLAELGAALFAGGRQQAQLGAALAASGRPVLVLWGRDDRVIPAAHAERAPKGATVKVLDGAGHMSMMEKANEVNAALRAHVSG